MNMFKNLKSVKTASELDYQKKPKKIHNHLQIYSIKKNYSFSLHTLLFYFQVLLSMIYNHEYQNIIFVIFEKRIFGDAIIKD